MLKQVKRLSMLALAMSGAMQGATDILTSALNMGNVNAGTMAAAALIAEGAYCYSQRDFDDKGVYRTVGGEEDSAISDALYCGAYGTGWTVFENVGNQVTTDATWQGNAEKSMINTLCFWITKQITRTDMYKNLNRNSFLLRWVPDTTKIDDGVKKIALFAVVKTLVGKVITPSAAAPSVTVG